MKEEAETLIGRDGTTQSLAHLFVVLTHHLPEIVILVVTRQVNPPTGTRGQKACIQVPDATAPNVKPPLHVTMSQITKRRAVALPHMNGHVTEMTNADPPHQDLPLPGTTIHLTAVGQITLQANIPPVKRTTQELSIVRLSTTQPDRLFLQDLRRRRKAANICKDLDST